MVNSRKINDELNIFDGIMSNKMFVIMWVFICTFQIFVIEVLKTIMECCRDGLPWQHWVIAIALGLFSWVWDFFIKLVPDRICPEFGKKEIDPLQNEENNVLSLRKKRTQSFSLRNPKNDLRKEGSGRQGSFQ